MLLFRMKICRINNGEKKTLYLFLILHNALTQTTERKAHEKKLQESLIWFSLGDDDNVYRGVIYKITILDTLGHVHIMWYIEIMWNIVSLLRQQEREKYVQCLSHPLTESVFEAWMMHVPLLHAKMKCLLLVEHYTVRLIVVRFVIQVIRQEKYIIIPLNISLE